MKPSFISITSTPAVFLLLCLITNSSLAKPHIDTSLKSWQCGLVNSSVQFTPDSITFPPGLREEPLGCSTKPALKKITQTLSKIIFRLPNSYDIFFHEACVEHDMCYRHGSSTYGFKRKTCDQELNKNITNNCNSIRRNFWSRKSCLVFKSLIFLSINTFGGRYYRSKSSERKSLYCEYLPKQDQQGLFYGFWAAIKPSKSRLWQAIESHSNHQVFWRGQSFSIPDYQNLRQALLLFFMGQASDLELIQAVNRWTAESAKYTPARSLEQAHHNLLLWTRMMAAAYQPTVTIDNREASKRDN